MRTKSLVLRLAVFILLLLPFTVGAAGTSEAATDTGAMEISMAWWNASDEDPTGYWTLQDIKERFNVDPTFVTSYYKKYIFS